jgi:metal-dependent HD superfamily phosphatase/phosphodiesterase
VSDEVFEVTVEAALEGAAVGELAPAAAPEVETARDLESRFERRIVMTVPDRHNPKLHQVMELVNADDDLYAMWTAANVNAVERLGMTDHGPVHVKIVMNIAVRMLRLLADAGVEPGIVENYRMDTQDAEVVVALASLLHDLGMSIHRADHEMYSLFIAQSKLDEILPKIYSRREQTVVRSEVLHAIIAHRSDGKPLTVEAGVVRIADALDMAKGRSRIPFASGSLSIHSVSAAAVESVSIGKGTKKPIAVTVELSNSAGLFQLDQLLRNKLDGSGLEHHVEITAKVGHEEKKLILQDFSL